MEDQSDRRSSQPKGARSTPDPDEPGDLAAGTARRRRSRALSIGIAGSLAAVAVAVTVIAGSSSGSLVAGTKQTAQAKEISALLAGIPESGNALGSSSAPVTLQFFGDLECPTAREFTLAALPHIISEWVRPGTMRIEFRSLRSVSEPEAFGAQQVAALAAGTQDKLWYFLEYFYREQGPEHSAYVTESYLSSLARQVSGLSLTQWSEERNDPELVAQVTQDEQLARATHLTGTPSFLVGRTDSIPLYGMGESSSLGDINYAVRRVLKSQGS